MSDKKKPGEVLEQFCTEWNATSFYPKLYPVHMVPQTFERDVIKAQLDLDIERAIELPDDVQDAEAFVQWARQFENNEPKFLDTVALQVVAVDRRGRVAVFDVTLSLGPTGYVDRFTDIKIETMLSGFSRRKTWIDPKMLGEYQKHLEGESHRAYVGEQSEERIFLFQKSLQAMIREKIRDVEKVESRKQQKAVEAELLQELIDELKEKSLDLKTLADSKKISVGVEDGVGRVKFDTPGIGCQLTTKSTSAERAVFSEVMRVAFPG